MSIILNTNRTINFRPIPIIYNRTSIYMKSFRDLGLKSDDSCFIIAEGGINHNGSIDLAKRLIDIAKEKGCDAIKFQKRKVDRILTRTGLNAPYINDNSYGATYGEHKRALELSEDQFRELKAYADAAGILFSSSGWDEESVDFLDSLNIPFFKVASADLTNFPLLEHTAKKGRPIVLSTGMADMATVIAAVNWVRQWNDQIALMQCTSTYPCPAEHINLRVIQTYQQQFPECVIGFSSHSRGPQIPVASVALGAKVVEIHITMDRTMKGGDHAASLEPHGLELLVRDIRVIEAALGSPVKQIQPDENRCFIKLAKSVVSATAIVSGTQITREMLTTKGPGTGISPMHLYDIIGRRVNRDIDEDMVLTYDMLHEL